MTLLQAINLGLSALGESRVTSDTTRNPTVDLLRETIQAQTQELLEMGWWFNTVFDATASPGPLGEVEAPNGVLSIFGNRLRLIERGGMLFDLTNNTRVFKGSVRYSYTYTVDFQDLPESAATVVALRATSIVYSNDLGVDSNVERMQEDIARNYMTLEMLHLRNMSYNTRQRGDWVRYRRALRG